MSLRHKVLFPHLLRASRCKILGRSPFTVCRFNPLPSLEASRKRLTGRAAFFALADLMQQARMGYGGRDG